jgi:isochorismate hydrolase
VEAFSDNFRVAIVEEGCFDRSEVSHALSLCDMHAKYADVVKLDEALTLIEGLPDDLFVLPRGS